MRPSYELEALVRWIASMLIALAVVGFGLYRRLRWCRANGMSVRGNVFENRLSLVVFLVLNVSTVATLVRSMLIGNFEHVFLCLLSLVLFQLPIVLQRGLRIQLPSTLMIVVLVFIYAAEIQGEIENYYGNVPGWDTALHTVNGFLCAAIGFALVDLLNRSSRTSLSLSPGYLAFVSFCFSMTVGVLWEFLEFGVDSFLGLDMQKDFFVSSISSVALNPAGENVPVAIRGIVGTTLHLADGSTYEMAGYLDIGLVDTMKDLLVNFVGAVTFSAIGFLYVRGAGRGADRFVVRVARRFIPVVLEPSRHAEDEPVEDEAAEGEAVEDELAKGGSAARR